MKNKFSILLSCLIGLQFAMIQTSAQVIKVDMDDAEIIDLGFPDSQRPKTPNAGTKVLEARKPLDAKFDFDRKIEFRITGKGTNYNSWFYLNLKEGYSMMDTPGLKKISPESWESGMEMNQITDPDYVMYSYVKNKDGKFAMKLGDESQAIITDMKSEFQSEEFFSNFKKTGKVLEKGKDGVPFKRAEYKGFSEGKPVSVWLADAQDVKIDTKKISHVTGHMGLGYVASPNGKTYLVCGTETDGVAVFITGITKENKSFSGAGYQPIGGKVMAGQNIQSEMNTALAEMQKAIDEEKDPQKKQLMIKQMKINSEMMEGTAGNLGRFENSSNIYEVTSSNYEDEFYESMLNNYKTEYREYELSLKKDIGPDETKRIKCEMSCNLIKQNRIERLQSETKSIRNQYKNDTDKADELINSLIQGATAELLANPCECGN